VREEPIAPPRLLHQIFERQAGQTPEAVAVAWAQGRSTYSQLNARANQLAGFLRAQGAGCACCVAILLPRSERVYLAILGVLKTGAAYVPLEPEYPAERVSFILADCGATILLTSGELGLKAAGFQGKTVFLDRLDDELSAFADQPANFEDARGEDLAYIIYTSGTTGRPKGVQIEHRSIVHLVQTERALFNLQPQDRVFQGFSVAFDASVEEIWLAFSTGATLVTGTVEMLRSGDGLAQQLADAGVTVLSCVPTLLAMMEQDVPGLRLLILGGEVCPSELVKRWSKPGRRVVNTYGPTETTVVATYAECAPDRPVTIGRPLPGYDAIVADEKLEPVPLGAVGELLVGGVGLARGYLGKPELTQEKFVWLQVAGGPPRRFYRTGDRARWTQGGELEFLGRLDSQVKIRGFRVELEEVEAALLDCPELKAAGVSIIGNNSGAQRLVAYVVPRSGATVDPAKLTAGLKRRLPPFMLPSAIEVLDSLPTLPSGKIDRKALPAPRTTLRTQERVPPRTEIETQLAGAWARLFSIPEVSIADDFFLDLGGHSLAAARMVSELRRSPTFQLLSMADIYSHPTIAGLAAELEARLRPKGHSGASRKPWPGASGKPEEHVPALSGFSADEHAAPTQPISIPFWRHFVCGLAQLLSLIFVLSFFALQWLAPYLTYTVLIEEEYEVATAIFFALGSLVLLYPLMLLLAIGLKWLIIGRYKPGSYPMWGGYYFRFWLATSIEATVPVSYLSGTPLLSIYLRLMGARIGRDVFLQTDSFAIYDLLEIGDESSANAEASLLGYSVSGGRFHLGPICIGRRCFVGTRAALAPGSRMEDDSTLEDLSFLQTGQRVASGEAWIGSPARLGAKPRATDAPPEANATTAGRPASAGQSFAFGFLHALGLLVFPVLVVAALFPGIVLMNRLNYLDPYYWYLLLSPLVAGSFIALLCVEIVALKWLLLGRIRPSRFPLGSWYYLRKWFVDKTLELSLDVVGPLYASVYLSPWYKALGAKLGRGAEISTASFISPDLLTIGEESFIADDVSLGAPRVEKGFMRVGPNQIGRRAFIGNSAMLPPDTRIGDEVLIGCFSAPPEPADALRPDSAWLGSPALFLPQRHKSDTFGRETTFDPPARLRVLRAAIEFVRVISPSTGFIILTSLLFSALLLLHDHFSLAQTLLFFPPLYLACGLAASAFTIVAKWCLVGRYRPGEKPLWSTFVWRNELINALHEHFAGPFLVGALTGTPFIAWYFRLLGARIGRRTYIETADFSEFDLARIGDEAALNTDCTIQTHLFEDRVMKMDFVEIGPHCSVGARSLVLYDTRMEAGSELGPLSLLMKGEVLPPGTAWSGIPAQAQGYRA
jgi:non-ribosomal peptide synthetase-like protein